VIGAVTFLDGYNFYDALLFRACSVHTSICLQGNEERKESERLSVELHDTLKPKKCGSICCDLLRFCGGHGRDIFGAEPFINSLEGLASYSGVSIVMLAIIISPIAGEMPEKISMILLARKGSKGASIAVANVLGSKIVNNTLLLAVVIFAAIAYRGFGTLIANTSVLEDQMILVTAITGLP